MKEPVFDPEVDYELHNAHVARAAGNEGRARVCARRAAGLAVRKYFERKDFQLNNKSAYELLLTLINQPGIPPTALQNAINLTMRVSESFMLPTQVDLIIEARSLCEQLAKL
ncbi:MAG: hypothetical protein A2X25_05165 [Chloroflexi bacterium GWB2_49_20]|nr:MAG: hypothetical protein A2X25_05165 [Chloroflexi bacterium GWB2_49_20]OGN78565.1 MAG: hypothetical protein A2X26_12265 [Chloroflexi bacterium GWC2_49_37]OGN83262.1 MAG: hypothetical protein A2X27_13685 [Chloroflexi bacterium GWD2_49_16]HBG75136.1 hypothetical protein [Anaerolineae bacterium]HCC78944.1 hypothetical protein [Anaerolineae bacterium]